MAINIQRMDLIPQKFKEKNIIFIGDPILINKARDILCPKWPTNNRAAEFRISSQGKIAQSDTRGWYQEKWTDAKYYRFVNILEFFNSEPIEEYI